MSDDGRMGVEIMGEDGVSTMSSEKSTPGGEREHVEEDEEPYVVHMQEAWKLERVIAVTHCDSLEEYKDLGVLQNKLAELLTSGEYMYGLQAFGTCNRTAFTP